MEGRDMKRVFVIIGGPGFGKTALVRALEKMGYYCQFDDISRELIGKLSKRSAGVDTSGYEFNMAILEKRVEQFEKAPENRVCFFDRGVPDSIAYMDSPPEEFIEMARKYRYQSLVFVTPPWKDIFKSKRADRGRAEGSFEEALRLHDLILKVYGNLGYKLVELPKADVKERVKFVIDEVVKLETKRRLKFLDTG